MALMHEMHPRDLLKVQLRGHSKLVQWSEKSEQETSSKELAHRPNLDRE